DVPALSPDGDRDAVGGCRDLRASGAHARVGAGDGVERSARERPRPAVARGGDAHVVAARAGRGEGEIGLAVDADVERGPGRAAVAPDRLGRPGGAGARGRGEVAVARVDDRDAEPAAIAGGERGLRGWCREATVEPLRSAPGAVDETARVDVVGAAV